jgi:inosine triphosphate pyrophosphatase
MVNLVFVTGNQHKISEVKAILGHSAVIKTASLDLPEIQGTLEEITREKCRVAARKVRCVQEK